MRNHNDPASGSENKFLEGHDLLKQSLSKPEIAALISPADQATILDDNLTLHQEKTASEQAAAVAKQATKRKNTAFKSGRGNYCQIRQRFMTAVGYTPALGVLAGIARPPSAPPDSQSADGPQPVLRGKPGPEGGAWIKSTKGHAEAVDIYSKREGDANLVFLMRVLHFPWVDDRPLLVDGQPEKREYCAMFMRRNKPYGKMSAIITVIVSA
jgi:hypothetical protein